MHSPRLFIRRLSHSLADARLSFLRRELQDLHPHDPVTALPESEPPPPQEPKQLQQVTARGGGGGGGGRRVVISQQWPEWAQFIEILFKKGYLDPTALAGPKNSNLIRTASLNFARDRFDLIRYFSRRDIHIVAGAGCPSLDRKVVNSGKRLRVHVGIDEGDVCSSCNLRGNCERAYVKARDDENGRTVDVMRFLLTYGLDLTNGSLDNQVSFSKLVKESVRNLMKEMVELSDKEFSSSTLNESFGQPSSRLDKKSTGYQMPRAQRNALTKQGDWICPKCNFLNFAKNINCLRCNSVFQERLDKLRGEHEHLPLKRGDWKCEKCNFLNFAKNTRCLQCQEKPPKRDLNPGEWECPSCNYINFRKNMVCLKCDWKRPKASGSGDNGDRKGSYLKGSVLSFVRNNSEASSLQRCSSDEEGTSFWSCEEDETDEDDSDNNSWNRFADDFPILGGNGVVSKDPPCVRERWKGEMSKGRFKSLEEDDVDEMDCYSPTGAELDESSDEDDVAGWFRNKNRN